MSELSIAGVRLQAAKRTTIELVADTVAGKMEIPMIAVAGRNPGPRIC
jgi:hypothetical protein